MSEQWDKRMMEFLKRTGEDIKAETERLVTEVRDPAKQQKVKAALKEFGVWAKKTAEDAADMVETAVRKAETAWKKPADGANDDTTDSYPTSASTQAAEVDDDERTPTDPPPEFKAPVKKTVGRKSGGPAPKKKAKPAAKKTVGKKKP